jgi:hypothetical protein
MSYNNIPVSTEKSFGIVFSVVFLVIALYPLMESEEIHIWAISISVIFLFLAYFIPSLLSVPNKLWFKFGMLLSSIVSPIVMAFVYFITVLPTGLIMKLLGKNLLNKNFDKNVKTYWINRKEPMGSMKNQF